MGDRVHGGYYVRAIFLRNKNSDYDYYYHVTILWVRGRQTKRATAAAVVQRRRPFNKYIYIGIIAIY